MWSSFHQIRLIPNFRAKWQQLFCHSMDADPHYLYQYLTDVIFRKIITSKLDIIQSTEGSIIQPLTKVEEHALKYSAGYVCKQIVIELE